MSELADRERREKRSWAAPGRGHDKLIAVLKLALPALIGVLFAFLVFSPLEEKQEVSFVFNKNEVQHAEERMRIQSAEYRGQDSRGRPFVLSARQAVQQSSAVPIVDVRDMSARIQLDSGPARLVARQALYDMETDKVDVRGPVVLSAADGYRLGTRDVVVDLRQRNLASRGPVEGRMPLGHFTAGRLQVDLADRRAVLTHRARLHIVQGAVH
jgi:lipopolysaccharide export system protein LptC